MTRTFKMLIKKSINRFRLFSFCDSVRQIVFAEHDKFAQHIACYSFWSFKLEHKSNLSIFSPELLTTENFLPFTDEVTVELVHKCIQQLHLLALHFEILGYIPGLLNGLEHLRRTGDFSGDNITGDYCEIY